MAERGRSNGDPTSSEGSQSDQLPQAIRAEDALYKQVCKCTGGAHTDGGGGLIGKLTGKAAEVSHGEHEGHDCRCQDRQAPW